MYIKRTDNYLNTKNNVVCILITRFLHWLGKMLKLKISFSSLDKLWSRTKGQEK